MEHAGSTKQWLPVELLIHVVSYIPEKRDIAKLCSVSTLFNSISLPFLYKNLNIDDESSKNWYLQLEFFKILGVPRYSSIVTTIELKFCGKYACNKKKNSFRGACTCKDYDDQIGRLLNGLINLQSLYFNCNLCPGEDHHSYLDSLQPRKLQVFKFRCFCLYNQQEGVNKPGSTSLLTAPFMQNVTSLALMCPKRCLLDDTGRIENVLGQPNVLPALSTLAYSVLSESGEYKFPSEVLAARPIRRLYYHGIPSAAEASSPAQQTLEYIMSYDIMQWLPPIVTNYPRLYANLRSIGTITLRSSKEEDILHALKPFSILRSLHTIEVNQFISEDSEDFLFCDPTERFEPSDVLVQRLAQQHRALRRIYHVHRPNCDVQRKDATLWEQKYDDVWTKRTIPLLNQWEVVNGVLESI
ncbi:hypothetical protein M408DRAFT_9723 [Serendipita vermifera MAFF 305830]|uniref:F-box domain-containing protein n=1 Tax=Serendipita vermifera MAFF 305830 TaxID=933852 RepID=A0A0C3AQ26_SERVB|nr:hypothetical protein M408DRAFT_9723 [Serendipita vermifera MAFF 305830]